MLKLIFGYPSDIVRNPDVEFSYVFKREWLFNAFNKKCITIIDRAIIDTSLFMYNEFNELIGPENLSTGCKSLMLLNNDNSLMIPLEFMGDNCFDLLCELSEENDIRVCSSNPRRLFKHGFKKVFIVNTNKIITNGLDFLREYSHIEDNFYGEYAYEYRGW